MKEKESKIYDWKVNINKKELDDVVKNLKEGKLIVFPTETVYGIGTDTYNKKGCLNIYKAKGRPVDNPLIVHVSDYEMLKRCVKNISKVEEKLINAFMPGPFTLILEKKEDIPEVVTSGLDTVAIRMPDNKICNKIISELGKPIAAPSANRSGLPSGTNLEDIIDELKSSVDIFIDGGDTEIGLESTVVRVIDDVPCILRPGKITAEDILKVVGKVKIDQYVLNEVDDKTEVLSPGMKHKHYSPKTLCILLDVNDAEKEKVIEFIKDKNICILGVGKNTYNTDRLNYLSMGSTVEEISKNIFSLLRDVDKRKYDLILIESVPIEGLGLAIMNRLIRTCGYSIAKSKKEVEIKLNNNGKKY